MGNFFLQLPGSSFRDVTPKEQRLLAEIDREVETVTSNSGLNPIDLSYGGIGSLFNAPIDKQISALAARSALFEVFTSLHAVGFSFEELTT